MLHWFSELQLPIFSIHLIVFSTLAFRRRTWIYVVTAIIFLLLVLYRSFFKWMPESLLWFYPLHLYFRAGALMGTGVSFFMVVRRYLRKNAS